MRDLEAVRRLAPPVDPPDAAAVARMRARALRRPAWRRRWLLAPALAGAVLALLGILLPGGGGQERAFAAAAVRAAEGAPRLLLGGGWTVTRVDEWSAGSGEMTFSDGAREMELSWMPAAVEPTEVGAAKDPDAVAVSSARVPGGRADIYRYDGAQDFSAAWLSGDALLQARGTGIGADEFRAILEGLEAVDAHAWLSALPAGAVTPSEQPDAVDEMLAGLPLPPGFDRAALRDSGETRDRYQLGAKVAGAVACGWIAAWVEAKDAGDDPAAARAAGALASSRGWPVLREMNAEGDYPEVLWHYADAVAGPGTVDGGKPAMSVKETYRNALCS